VNPIMGIIGCKLWYPGGEILQHAGGYLTRPQAMPGHFGLRERDLGQYDTPQEVDYVIGAAMAIRRETLVATGLLDEEIFLYFEDVDFCVRARRAGYHVVYLPQAKGIHVESATITRSSIGYLHRFHSGRWHFLLKHYPVGDLLEITLPAEASWLASLAPVERQAAAMAYRASLYNLPAILHMRFGQGAGSLAEDDQWRIEEALIKLYQRALKEDEMGEFLNQVLAQTVNHPPVFSSHVPLIGPLISRFRTFWNDMAGRWYVDHIRRQQAEFNRLAVTQLNTLSEELKSRQAMIEDLLLLQMTLRRHARAIEAKLVMKNE
jgi:hypothetical protein